MSSPPRAARRSSWIAILLVFLACSGVFLYWRCRPAQVARQFVEAVQQGEYQEADDLFIEPADRFVVALMKRREGVYPSVQEQTLSQWVSGICELTLTDYGTWTPGLPTNQLDENCKSYVYSIEATARGLRLIERYEPISGGSFGGF